MCLNAYIIQLFEYYIENPPVRLRMVDCARHLHSIRRLESGLPAMLGPSTRIRGYFRSPDERKSAHHQNTHQFNLFQFGKDIFERTV